MTIILFAAVAVFAAVIMFVSGRRFGYVAAGLAIGALLSGWWSAWLAGFLTSLKINVDGLPNGAIAAMIFSLPALVLVFASGSKYKSMLQKIITSVLTVLLLLSLWTPQMMQFIVINDQNKMFFDLLNQYWMWTATACLAVGLIDMFLVGKTKLHKSKKH